MIPLQPGSAWSGIAYRRRGRRWVAVERWPASAIRGHAHGGIRRFRRFWFRSWADAWVNREYATQMARSEKGAPLGLSYAACTYQVLNFDDHPHAPPQTDVPK